MMTKSNEIAFQEAVLLELQNLIKGELKIRYVAYWINDPPKDPSSSYGAGEVIISEVNKQWMEEQHKKLLEDLLIANIENNPHPITNKEIANQAERSKSIEMYPEELNIPINYSSFMQLHNPKSEQKVQELNQIWLKIIDMNEQKAKKILEKPSIRRVFCPALETVSNDVFEIAKIITPIAIGLSIAGTISFPLTPLLCACVALLVSRMGVSTICADYKTDKSRNTER